VGSKLAFGEKKCKGKVSVLGAPNHLFIFGLGYSARFLARKVLSEGWQVTGTCQSQEKAADLALDGITPIIFDRDHPIAGLAEAFNGVTHILNSVPPDKIGDPVADLIAAHPDAFSKVKWIGYLSTTGVYGDTGGALVNETAPRRPTSDRSRRRVEAEDAWLDLHSHAKMPVHLFRLPGLYGPGYSVLDRIRAGEAKNIVKPGHAFCRIHVDDLAQTLCASMDRPNPGAIYNVCDDEPAPPSELTLFGCQLLGVEPPASQNWDDILPTLSPMALSFWQDNRRVDNSRIKEDLDIELLYPSYREGLTEIAKI